MKCFSSSLTFLVEYLIINMLFTYYVKILFACLKGNYDRCGIFERGLILNCHDLKLGFLKFLVLMILLWYPVIFE